MILYKNLLPGDMFIYDNCALFVVAVRRLVPESESARHNRPHVSIMFMPMWGTSWTQLQTFTYNDDTFAHGIFQLVRP